MKRVRAVSKLIAGGVAICGMTLLAPVALAESVEDCQALAGFNATGISGGAAGLVSEQGDAGAFLGRKQVMCVVKYVQPSAKAKPQTVNLTLDGDTSTDTIDPMAADECSMYAYLSSIHSKLGQAKLSDAYSVANSLNAKIDDLRNTGKLTDAGWNVIKPATSAIQACVTTLINQP